MTRRSALGAGGVIAMLLIAGCGGGSGGEADTTGDPAPSEVPVTALDEADATEPTAAADTVAPTTSEAPVEVPGTIVEVGAPTIDPADVATATLSAAQLQHVEQAGVPDRFEITFLAETLPDGTPIDIRHEAWHDDETGVATVYRNGDMFTQHGSGQSLAAESIGSTPYLAEWFTATMTLDELLAVTYQTAYYEIPTDPVIDGGTLITVQGLMAGFEDGTLRYVQTIPLERE